MVASPLRPHPRRPGEGAQALPRRDGSRSARRSATGRSRSRLRPPPVPPARSWACSSRPRASTTRSSPTPWAPPTSTKDDGHDLRDRRPGRQVRLPEERRAHRLRHERGLLRRHRLVPRGVGRRATSTSSAPRRSATSPSQAEAPLKFGEHCSAFINSDIRKAIQQGADARGHHRRARLLHRVQLPQPRGGQPHHRQPIVLQGGVAKNQAVPLAFAMLLDKPILVPPDPELMGCFGVGILARQKFNEGADREEVLFHR